MLVGPVLAVRVTTATATEEACLAFPTETVSPFRHNFACIIVFIIIIIINEYTRLEVLQQVQKWCFSSLCNFFSHKCNGLSCCKPGSGLVWFL